jgi:hypothetical protein
MQLGFDAENKTNVTANNMDQVDFHGEREDPAIGLLPITKWIMCNEFRTNVEA